MTFSKQLAILALLIGGQYLIGMTEEEEAYDVGQSTATSFQEGRRRLMPAGNRVYTPLSDEEIAYANREYANNSSNMTAMGGATIQQRIYAAMQVRNGMRVENLESRSVEWLVLTLNEIRRNVLDLIASVEEQGNKLSYGDRKLIANLKEQATDLFKDWKSCHSEREGSNSNPEIKEAKDIVNFLANAEEAYSLKGQGNS